MFISSSLGRPSGGATFLGQAHARGASIITNVSVSPASQRHPVVQHLEPRFFEREK